MQRLKTSHYFPYLYSITYNKKPAKFNTCGLLYIVQFYIDLLLKCLVGTMAVLKKPPNPLIYIKLITRAIIVTDIVTTFKKCTACFNKELKIR
ncbi:MAG: hypothetical protein RLZZ66_2452 [Pseudomonadota bacterium]|jgi:hypothetical protein